MSTEQFQLRINGLPVDVVRKSIKNLHLGVYPPNGRVRVAVPARMSKDAVRLAVINKLSWIRKQRSKFDAQARQSRREMVTGESHYFQGQRYRLRVVESDNPRKVVLKGQSIIEIHSNDRLNTIDRESLLNDWYRAQIKELVPQLIRKWSPVVGVSPKHFGIRKMKTKWGSCNTNAKRIWLNLELIKKPLDCLEYVLVHEMVHLIERLHNAQFISLMDKYLPSWRQRREVLNRAPLGHADWEY